MIIIARNVLYTVRYLLLLFISHSPVIYARTLSSLQYTQSSVRLQNSENRRRRFECDKQIYLHVKCVRRDHHRTDFLSLLFRAYSKLFGSWHYHIVPAGNAAATRQRKYTTPNISNPCGLNDGNRLFEMILDYFFFHPLHRMLNQHQILALCRAARKQNERCISRIRNKCEFTEKYELVCVLCVRCACVSVHQQPASFSLMKKLRKLCGRSEAAM